MPCLNPIVLKSGIVVPCGKCELCKSDKRTEWSIRLAIHASYCDRMPLFICLTYDDLSLPYVYRSDDLEFYWQRGCASHPDAYPSLYREDISSFIKAYKRKYHLLNDEFTYFGCGEYGDTFGRPHYHLLFFGDNELYDLYFKDSQLAEKRLSDVWQKGFVSIGVAQWSGIHYVTKYVLKEDIDELRLQNVVLPFTVASKGLGNAFLSSELAIEWKKKLQWMAYNQDYIYSHIPEFSLDNILSIDRVIDYLRGYFPSWLVPVDDGRFVYLPRPLRKRITGSFEYFKDSPVWLYQHLLNLKKSIEYYKDNGEYDRTHGEESWRGPLENRIQKIRERLNKRKFDNRYKRSKL